MAVVTSSHLALARSSRARARCCVPQARRLVERPREGGRRGSGRGGGISGCKGRRDGRPRQTQGITTWQSQGLGHPRVLIRRWSGVGGSSSSPEAASVTQEVARGDNRELLESLAAFLSDDLEHLFDSQGIDRSKYESDVEFLDPLTRYNNIEGYLFNIQMLRYLFSPKFTLHGVEISGEDELTTRWTMGMKFALLPWRPSVNFTGRSILTVNLSSGKFKRHVDVWDSIENNAYFSTEGLLDLLKQLLPNLETPNLETPTYEVLQRKKDFEVREYEAFAVAETKSEGGGLASGSGFNELAGYIFGGNEEEKKMDMTTPVFTRREEGANDGNVMQFVISDTAASNPTPNKGIIRLRDVEPDVYAVIAFSGFATDSEVEAKKKELTACIRREGLMARYNVDNEPQFILARYNEPTTLLFRRNELLVQLESFKLTY